MNFVTYKRVSTTRQGERGTSFEIQQQMIEKYLHQHHPEGYTIIGEFSEIETGTNKRRRVEVYKAIDLCKQQNAILCCAKLDRFSRDVEFLQYVFRSGIQFITTDFLQLSNPALNRMILTIMTSIAAYEAELIRDRITKGIQKSISSGKKWGQKNLAEYAGYKDSAINRSIKSIQHQNNRKALNAIEGKRKEHWTFKEIAEFLNKENYKTSRDRQFSSATVQQLYSKRGAFVKTYGKQHLKFEDTLPT